MKKSIFAILCIITAVVFAGCTAPVPKIANDYKFGYASENVDGLLESYTYTVTSQDDTLREPKPPFMLTGNGTYTVNLYKEEEEYKFRLETKLVFNGKYYFTAKDEYSQLFEDTVESISYAYINAESLTPISTVKTFETSLPIVENNENTSKKAYYTTTSTYTGNTISSQVKDNADYPDAFKVESEANKNFSAEIKERFVDNEFVFLAIRLQTLGTTFKDSFKVPDPLNGIMQTLSFQAAENTETKAFTDPADETMDKNFDCIVISSSLSGKYSGRNILMYYTNDYSVKYISGTTAIDRNISLMLEFKQENLLYSLDEYQNFAQKG